jgi:crotonobetainyl-CoA:carnitine CoA-transferase CaiB-like acyl-CoA transferase
VSETPSWQADDSEVADAAGTGLLSGVRVLDLTNVLAGPFAGYQLALFGADVVKVEVPGSGDLARQLGADPELGARLMGASFLAQNAGKRSVTVDLKKPAGKEVFATLVSTADVLVENFRPGVLDRLGFGETALRTLNNGLVYCAVSGFGATGPARARPAYDQIVQGMSGIMSVTGTPETAPLRVGFPVADSIGGLAAALAVSAALVRRSRTGVGAFLDVSMLDASLTAMGWVASDYLVAGRVPAPMANENPTSAPSGTFDTQDGALNIAANQQTQFESLCSVLGRRELLADPRFSTRDDRKRNRSLLRAELELTLRTRPAAEWDTLLLDAGVPAGRVLGVPEALESEQIRHRGLVTTLPLAGRNGTLQVLGSPTHVDGQPVAPRSPPPMLGEHTTQVLTELGYSSTAIGRLREGGAL